MSLRGQAGWDASPPHASAPMAPLYGAPPTVPRAKHGVVFAPWGTRDAERGAVPQGHLLFVMQAREVEYDNLVQTCLADAGLKTCAAVLVERFCFANNVDAEMLADHLRRLEQGDQFVEFWHKLGHVDLTLLPRDTLHTFIRELPVWHEAMRRVRAG